MLFSDRLTVNLLSKSDQTLGKLNVTSTGNLLVDARSAIPTSSLPTRSGLSRWRRNLKCC
jgi:hypothetical protein